MCNEKLIRQILHNICFEYFQQTIDLAYTGRDKCGADTMQNILSV